MNRVFRALADSVFAIIPMTALFLPVSAFADAFFLDAPGIVGEASPPGYSNIIAVNSYSFPLAGTFEFLKNVDKSSPSLSTAVINGTIFPSVNLYVFNTVGSVPTTLRETFAFSNDIFSSVTLLGTNPLTEDVKINYGSYADTFSPPVPEPSPYALMLAGLATLCATTRRQKDRCDLRVASSAPS